ncbi:hypothetical protein MJ575_07905 [Klebsiella pneumoniae]|nr:hypothetical protein MJ575_07905 [Klebsiella pneumoniae]
MLDRKNLKEDGQGTLKRGTSGTRRIMVRPSSVFARCLPLNRQRPPPVLVLAKMSGATVYRLFRSAGRGMGMVISPDAGHAAAGERQRYGGLDGIRLSDGHPDGARQYVAGCSWRS